MSVVIEIRRPGAPFDAAELDRAAASQQGLSFAGDQLNWTSPGTGTSITLNVTPDEIWTDAPNMTTGEGLDFLKHLAKTLGAAVYCEGEPLTDLSSITDQVAVTPAKTALGLLFVVLAAPFLFVWVIIRLPWALWHIKRGTK